ncbi:hypothetical protein WJX72_001523 [[Myrmecia] bisecta]|uniref:Mitochondrial carrier protein n=1 Tax=[Myrmecia] bisecta TaxID=41462 RepID=A0AAW1QE91_9CHLO
MNRAANTASGYAFDTVKVRLQASPRGTYNGSLDCLKSILRYEGVRGLYRGLSAPLIGGALETGINYAVYTHTVRLLRDKYNAPSHLATPVAAGTAGMMLSTVLGPFELVKCRMQLGVQGGYHVYTSPLHCIQQLIRNEGYWGLTRGIGATMAREVPGNAIFFSCYEALRHTFPGRPVERSRDQTFLQIVGNALSAIVCGGISGTVMWAAVLPIDTAKTRIQTAYPGSANNVGILANLQLMYHAGGRHALYAGLAPTLLRAFPANAAQWLTWEFFIRECVLRQQETDS